jgi:hypothetical protein
VHEGRSKELLLPLDGLEPRSDLSVAAAVKILEQLVPKRPVSDDAFLLNSDPYAHRRLAGLSRYVPNSRIVYLLREPADRVLSALYFEHRKANRRAPVMPEPRLREAVENQIHSIRDAELGALCIVAGVPHSERLATVLAAAALRSPASLPPCLDGRIVRCGDPRAASGSDAMAVWPLYAPPPTVAGGFLSKCVFYLTHVLEAQVCVWARLCCV